MRFASVVNRWHPRLIKLETSAELSALSVHIHIADSFITLEKSSLLLVLFHPTENRLILISTEHEVNRKTIERTGFLDHQWLVDLTLINSNWTWFLEPCPSVEVPN